MTIREIVKAYKNDELGIRTALDMINNVAGSKIEKEKARFEIIHD